MSTSSYSRDVGPLLSLKTISNLVDGVAPYSMSGLYGIRFSVGNAPQSGEINLNVFRGQTITGDWETGGTVHQPPEIVSYQYYGDQTSVSSDGNVFVASAPLRKIVTVSRWDGVQWNQVTLPIVSGSEYTEGTVIISGDGNTIVIGVPRSNANGNVNSGAAYVLVYSGTEWVQQAELRISDMFAFAYFAKSLAISYDGNTIFIGAPRYPRIDAGTVFIYTRSGSTWTLETTLSRTGEGSQFYYKFAQSLAVSDDGNTVIVGGWNDGGSATPVNLVQIFSKFEGSWSPGTPLVSTSVSNTDRFGFSVALSGDGTVAVVGAPYTNIEGYYRVGAAYIFTIVDGFWQETRVIPFDRVGYTYLGYSVAISSDASIVLIGSNASNSERPVYVYKINSNQVEYYDQWTYRTSNTISNFGYSASLSANGQVAVIGAPSDSPVLVTLSTPSRPGIVYIKRVTFFV
jgi:hypothetical protein